MAVFLIVLSVVLVVLALLAVALLTDEISVDEALERARIEMEVRRAERRLHDLASQGFEAMLIEARSHGRPREK